MKTQGMFCMVKSLPHTSINMQHGRGPSAFVHRAHAARALTQSPTGVIVHALASPGRFTQDEKPKTSASYTLNIMQEGGIILRDCAVC